MRKRGTCITLGLALVGGVAIADPTPDWNWLYPMVAPAPRPGADPMMPHRLPGSSRSFTGAETRNLRYTADWFPAEHPAMPAIVAAGHGNAFACGVCHLPTGDGRPESSALAGLPAEYIKRQIKAFANQSRRSPIPTALTVKTMAETAQAVSPDEIAQAAAYFSKLTFRSHVRVVETPDLAFRPVRFVYVLQPGPTQPIGNRIIEVPVDPDRFELHDPHMRFVAYVPPGSLAAGRALVRSGGPAGQPCAACHGAGLRGGIAPPLAGRSPTMMMRQLAAFQTGARASAEAAPMRAVTARLDERQMIAMAAYVATLKS